MTRRDAIKIVKEQGAGKKDDLVKLIGSDLFREFCLMGLIRQGVASVNSSPASTWSKTERVQDEYDFFFGSPGEREKELARLYKERFVFAG